MLVGPFSIGFLGLFPELEKDLQSPLLNKLHRLFEILVRTSQPSTQLAKNIATFFRSSLNTQRKGQNRYPHHLLARTGAASLLMQVEVKTLDDTVKIFLKLFPFPDVGLRLQGPLVDLHSARIITRSFPLAGFGLVEFCLGEFPSLTVNCFAQDRIWEPTQMPFLLPRMNK